jgi:Family of unknown function (DUF6941)
MKVEILTLCVVARPGINGELNALGITDNIFVPQFPIGINCNILAKMRFSKSEEGIKEIKILIVDQDGKPIQKSPPPQKINIKIHDSASSASAAMIFGIQNLQILKAGEYQIGLAVNEREEMSVPIFVRLIAQRPPAFPQSGQH